MSELGSDLSGGHLTVRTFALTFPLQIQSFVRTRYPTSKAITTGPGRINYCKTLYITAVGIITVIRIAGLLKLNVYVKTNTAKWYTFKHRFNIKPWAGSTADQYTSKDPTHTICCFISIAILAVIPAALAKRETPLALGWMLPTPDGLRLAVGTDPTPIVFGAGLTPANDDLKAGNMSWCMYIDTTSAIKKRDNLFTFTVFKKGTATTMMVERPVVAGANNTKNTEANTCYQFHVKTQKIIQGRYNQFVISADSLCLACDLESDAISVDQCDLTNASHMWVIDAFAAVPITDDAQEKTEVDQVEVEDGQDTEKTDQAEGGAPKDTTAPAKKAPLSMDSSDS
ncbi:hypothetical protein FB451DRAFT_1168279 [Mycena latifolia]|nr:hypothetical protein FB451DRAFT_1168279 [Mycena latifolia]